MAKTKFTEVILTDTKYQDTYWETEVHDAYNRTNSAKGVWMIRARADTAHGSSEAVQDAIDAGVYKSRT